MTCERVGGGVREKVVGFLMGIFIVLIVPFFITTSLSKTPITKGLSPIITSNCTLHPSPKSHLYGLAITVSLDLISVADVHVAVFLFEW